MDFSPDENQRAITGLAADVLRGELDAEATPGKRGYHEQAWRALGKAGLLGLSLPAELDGDDLGAAEVAAVLTEVGRQAAPVPALATLAMGVLPLCALGSAGQRAELLPAAAAGESVLTAALHEPSAPLTSVPGTTATAGDDGWRLDGRKTAVPFAEHAERMIVPAAASGGTDLFLVSPSAAGVELSPSPSATGSPEHTVRLNGVEIDPSGKLGGGSGVDALRVLHRFALAGACALGDGALAAALELTTSHVSTREQFGRPLATFQSASAQVADVYIASRTLHLATTSALWRLSVDAEPDTDLDVAAYWLTEQAPLALANCHHLHGGVGVDETYPLHRYYSLSKDLARFLGGSRASVRRLATSSIGGA